MKSVRQPSWHLPPPKFSHSNSRSLPEADMRRFSSVSSSFLFAMAAVLFTCLPSQASAQVDRSALTGTITESAGRLLTQTHITVIENATGLRREAVSDATGNYEIPDLPVGIYTVSFDHEGFKKLEFVDVEQVIGRTRTLNATLAGGRRRRDTWTSRTASELMDHNTSAVTGLIERTQADELPLNGRDWSALTAYVPGAIDTGGSNQRSVRFAGRGLDDSNFTYDGVDATNIANQTQRPWVRLSIPLDAIAGVPRRLADVDRRRRRDGRRSTWPSTSPSGTNRFHGRLFEYLRNDFFDAPLPEVRLGLQ